MDISIHHIKKLSLGKIELLSHNKETGIKCYTRRITIISETVRKGITETEITLFNDNKEGLKNDKRN